MVTVKNSVAPVADHQKVEKAEEEKVLFRRLSVFTGGFSLEAAEAVGAAGKVGADEIPGRLVEQSLGVVADTGGEGDEVRYRIPATGPWQSP